MLSGIITCGGCCAYAEHVSSTQVISAKPVACHGQEMCLCERSICAYELEQSFCSVVVICAIAS